MSRNSNQPWEDRKLENRPGEVWKDVVAYEGLYQVSNEGRVKSVARVIAYGKNWLRPIHERILRQHPCSDKGYLTAMLRCNNKGRPRLVHRLVLAAFVGPCPKGMQGCHNDGVVTNNRIENLRWDTPSANQMDRRKHGTANIGERNGSAKLTEKKVVIAKKLIAKGWTFTRVGKLLDVGHVTVRKAVTGETWGHVK